MLLQYDLIAYVATPVLFRYACVEIFYAVYN
jgi:hypothetical protein